MNTTTPRIFPKSFYSESSVPDALFASSEPFSNH